MTFNLGDVLNETIDRLTTSAAAIFIAVLTVIGIVQTAAVQDILRGVLEGFLAILNDPEFRDQFTAEELQQLDATEQEITAILSELPLALGLGPGTAAFLWFLLFVVSLVVVIVAIDTFAHRRDRLNGLQTSRVGWKTLNLFLGWIAFGILVLIGLILLVLPGIVIAVVLVFFAAAIVIDDQSFISAFGSSYRVVRNNIGGTLGIVALTLGVFIGISIIETALSWALPALLTIFLNNLLTGIGQVFAIALIAIAYADATTADSEPQEEDQTAPPQL